VSAISTPPLAVVEENIPNARRSRRTTKIRGVRAGFWV
jgi:cellobiose transport system permease protein